MGKRVAGWVWIVAGAVAVVISAVLLPRGGVASLLAALCLSAGVAVAVFGVTVLVRAEGAALRAAVSPADARRRARRSMWAIVVMAFLVPVLAAVSVLTTVLSGAALSPANVVFVIGGALAVAGGIVVAIELSRSRRGDPDPLQPGIAAPPEGDVWVVVARRDIGAMLLYAASFVGFALLLGFTSLRLIVLLLENTPAAWVVVVLLVAVLSVAGGWWLWRRFPAVSVNPGLGLIRAGGRELAASEVSSARLTVASTVPGGPRTLFLTLEGPRGFRAPLLLRRGGRLVMTEVERGAALSITRAASIRLPHAPEDPKGKFSRFSHPGYVDATQAASVVEKPPRDGEELPVSLV
ncbi:hypothetical protein [Microbacterium sp. IEGM 1404]|uniref:hypothetical protein n=1 Tax=Microbacterium sp. IEGM 1404 TaxID=3047084 RepID=UPI0024B778C1|nr:hypothetical protein [Microbacterium sp. IEGM 1404]MDI9890352.1 hypothetical protein [Microbacterium sp. IEGM 1404]